MKILPRLSGPTDEDQPRLGERAIWPNLAEAPGLLQLAKSTLLKRAPAGPIRYDDVLGFGQGRHILSPEEVLRIGHRYGRQLLEVQARLAAFLAPRLQQETLTVVQMLSPLVATLEADEMAHRDGAGPTESDFRQRPIRFTAVSRHLRNHPEMTMADPVTNATEHDTLGTLRFGELTTVGYVALPDLIAAMRSTSHVANLTDATGNPGTASPDLT